MILQQLESILYFLLTNFGYFGIFVIMTIESSFIPLAGEIILIPAGYLASQGKLSIVLVILFGVLGSVLGALINYYIGYKLGRQYILKNSKLFFMTKKHLIKTENFFNKYGEITILVSRIMFVIRQYISLPAGFAKMNLFKFILFTFLGATVWVSLFAFIGYFGSHIIEKVISIFNYIVVIVIILSIVYIIYNYLKRKSN